MNHFSSALSLILSLCTFAADAQAQQTLLTQERRKVFLDSSQTRCTEYSHGVLDRSGDEEFSLYFENIALREANGALIFFGTFSQQGTSRCANVKSGSVDMTSSTYQKITTDIKTCARGVCGCEIKEWTEFEIFQYQPVTAILQLRHDVYPRGQCPQNVR